MVDMTEKERATGGLPGKMPRRENRPHNPKRVFAICCGAMLLLVIAAMTAAVHRGKQSTSSIPIPVSFIGEYSQNGGEWQTLTEYPLQRAKWRPCFARPV